MENKTQQTRGIRVDVNSTATPPGGGHGTEPCWLQLGGGGGQTGRSICVGVLVCVGWVWRRASRGQWAQGPRNGSPLTLEVILKLQSACTPLKMSLKCRVGLGWDPGFCTSHRSLAMPRRLVRPLSGKGEGRKLTPVLARIRLGPKCLWRRGTEPRFLFPK